MTPGTTLTTLDPNNPTDLWDRSNHRSILNLVPPVVQVAMLRAVEEKPEYFDREERGLMKELKGEGYMPSPTDNRLRIKFWMEYDRAQAMSEKMNILNVTTGVCTRQYFYGTYLARADKMAWLLCLPASYEVKMEEALEFGIEQLRDILELPVVGPSGRVDSRLAELKAKIVAMMDIRVKGAITQKVESKSMNLNINTSDQKVAKVAMQGTMADIEKRIKELEGRDRVSARRAKEQGDREVPQEAEIVSEQ